MRRDFEEKLWAIFIAVTLGMSLLFMVMSSYPLSTRAMGGVAGIGIVLLQLSLRKIRTKRRAREELVDDAVILVEGHGSGELFLGTGRAIANPRLVVECMGGRVVVEDAWHDGVSVLSGPTSVSHWREGVIYPGILSVLRPLKLLVHNESSRAATVRARVYAKRS